MLLYKQGFGQDAMAATVVELEAVAAGTVIRAVAVVHHAMGRVGATVAVRQSTRLDTARRWSVTRATERGT